MGDMRLAGRPRERRGRCGLSSSRPTTLRSGIYAAVPAPEKGALGRGGHNRCRSRCSNSKNNHAAVCEVIRGV